MRIDMRINDTSASPGAEKPADAATALDSRVHQDLQMLCTEVASQQVYKQSKLLGIRITTLAPTVSCRVCCTPGIQLQEHAGTSAYNPCTHPHCEFLMDKNN